MATECFTLVSETFGSLPIVKHFLALMGGDELPRRGARSFSSHSRVPTGAGEEDSGSGDEEAGRRVPPWALPLRRDIERLPR